MRFRVHDSHPYTEFGNMQAPVINNFVHNALCLLQMLLSFRDSPSVGPTRWSQKLMLLVVNNNV